MQLIRSVCVYCGSSPGNDPRYLAAAEEFGKSLAENGIQLVYGGGGLGLMGAIAQSARAHGGRVVGIIPEFLIKREHMLEDVTQQIATPDMHTRKQLMFDHSDAFVAFPGGVGTLEELVEQLTWAQLGRHTKPILIADLHGYWQPLLQMLAHMERHAFIRRQLSVPYVTADRVSDIIPALEQCADRARAQPETATAAAGPISHM